jgi:hypothetical protein
MELFNFTVKDAHACTHTERKKTLWINGWKDWVQRDGCSVVCAHTHTHREKKPRPMHYGDRERRDQVEQPYAGRVPCAGVTADQLWRRCPRRFVAGVLIARLLLPSSCCCCFFCILSLSHTLSHRERWLSCWIN